MKVHHERIRALAEGKDAKGPVVYWMSREQRAEDNWAMLYAREHAAERGVPLHVCFCLVPEFLDATIRQYDFMLKGLQETEEALRKKGVVFHLLLGDPAKEVPKFVAKVQAGLLVTDFDPLRIKRQWKKAVADAVDIAFDEVDAHNIVPVWTTSDKQEYAARTIRPKIHKRLDEFLEDFPKLEKQTGVDMPEAVDWFQVYGFLKVNTSVPPVKSFTPGSSAAGDMLGSFTAERLHGYDTGRNDPTKDKLSNLSPYLHFGQLAAQRAVLEAVRSDAPRDDKDAFVEEIVVRKELTDNFCLFNEHYDSIKGIPDWAKTSLDEHKTDKREHVYTLEEFEAGRTHQPLWNAAQLQMVQSGKMHGYMRMYWAKKILEWTEDPAEAISIGIHLNDKYELDGRDPNGYVGVLWSVGGVHDRPWQERPIFGKIRYMNSNGCRRKFDVEEYIETWADPQHKL